MCIAIYKPAGKTITKDVLKVCFDNNSDGAGFAYVNTDYHGNRRLRVYKYMDFEPFYEKYEKYTRLMPESPFVIHFRIKTHGKKDIANCHPFVIDHDTVFIHNGIISGVGHDAEMSDTRLFNREILQKLPKLWYKNDAIIKLVEDFIGLSKLVVLDVDGTAKIINESKGVWHEDIWWSNETFKVRRTYTTTSYWENGSTTTYHGNAQRWKDRQEADNKKQKEKVEEKKRVPITTSSWSSCDACNRSFRLSHLEVYKVENDYMAFCPTCVAGEKKSGFINQKDSINLGVYIERLNKLKDKDLLDDMGFDSFGNYVGVIF